jgi:hypothetical protein
MQRPSVAFEAGDKLNIYLCALARSRREPGFCLGIRMILVQSNAADLEGVLRLMLAI